MGGGVRKSVTYRTDNTEFIGDYLKKLIFRIFKRKIHVLNWIHFSGQASLQIIVYGRRHERYYGKIKRPFLVVVRIFRND